MASGGHKLQCIHNCHFLANVRYMSSSVCLSSVMFVHPTQAIEIFGNVSTPWPPVDIQVKFYGDRPTPRGTPPLGELNIRGVAKYSDFGPIERYISETVQDRS